MSFFHHDLLTAADCNAQLEMSLPTLVQTLVEVATAHANHLGVGHARLARDGRAWVLMRLTMGMERMPRVGEEYEVETWVVSLNRRFSQRDFAMRVAGSVILRARSIWGVINSADRTPATLDGLEALVSEKEDRQADVPALTRVRPEMFESAGVVTRPYEVVVSDIDSNRHLTAPRYVELMLDNRDLEFFDRNHLSAFEISYGREARFGECLRVESAPAAASESVCRIMRGDDQLASAVYVWKSRE